ncbi:MAG: hypothetical protein EBV07_00345 [Proteobacteria bacterium]|nr:hypothetical protein [Pseudomonadota bacterium]
MSEVSKVSQISQEKVVQRYLEKLDKSLEGTKFDPSIGIFYDTENDYSYCLAQIYERLKERSQATKAGRDTEEIDAHLKYLLDNKEIKAIFTHLLVRGRDDLVNVRRSEQFNQKRRFDKETETLDEEIDELRRQIAINDSPNETASKSLQFSLIRALRRRSSVEVSFSVNHSYALSFVFAPKTSGPELDQFLEENKITCDVLALQNYERIRDYRRQLLEGYVWTDSRKELLEDIVDVILKDGKYPILIGESGTGKSSLANAAALKFTGYLPLTVACNDNLNPTNLGIGTTEIGEKGSYQKYGPVMQALSGKETSNQNEPTMTGRWVRFEEFFLADDKIYAFLKDLFSKKAGDTYEREVIQKLFGFIFTTNPDGQRYQNRRVPDAAFMRECRNIEVDYLPMTESNPELFQFMLACLMDDMGVIKVPKEELTPHFTISEIPYGNSSLDFYMQDVRTIDTSHGFLYRMSFAIRAVQDAFNNYDKPESARVSTEGIKYQIKDTVITPEDIKNMLSSYTDGSLREAMHVEFRKFLSNIKNKEDLEVITKIFQIYIPEMLSVDSFFRLQPSTNICTPLEIGYLLPNVQRPYIKKEVEENDMETYSSESFEFSSGKLKLSPGDIVFMKKPSGEFVPSTFFGSKNKSYIFKDTTTGYIYSVTSDEINQQEENIRILRESGLETEKVFYDYERSKEIFEQIIEQKKQNVTSWETIDAPQKEDFITLEKFVNLLTEGLKNTDSRLFPLIDYIAVLYNDDKFKISVNSELVPIREFNSQNFSIHLIFKAKKISMDRKTHNNNLVTIKTLLLDELSKEVELRSVDFNAEYTFNKYWNNTKKVGVDYYYVLPFEDIFESGNNYRKKIYFLSDLPDKIEISMPYGKTLGFSSI